MSDLTGRRHSSKLALRDGMDDLMEELELPRSIRKQAHRLFDEDLPPREVWSRIDGLLNDFDPPGPWRRRVARLFEPFAGGPSRPIAREEFSPRLDLVEREDAYVLSIDLPGVKGQDVDLSIDDDGVLTVQGERHRQEYRRELGYHRSERSWGSFSRSVELPHGIDSSRLDATFRDGVLEVHVPKLEAARARSVPIRQVETPDREAPRVLHPGDARRREQGTVDGNGGR